MPTGFEAADARARVAGVIAEIEGATSAEIVVAVRRVAGAYRDVDYLVGFAVSLAALCVLLFHPREFLIETMPFDVVASFVLGAVVSARTPPLRRALTTRTRRRTAVHAAARAAIVDRGVARTRGRTGVLVFVGLLEREVEIVCDVGVDASHAGIAAAFDRVASAGARVDFEAFVAALRGLRAPLAAALPRSEDDENELPDAMEVA